MLLMCTWRAVRNAAVRLGGCSKTRAREMRTQNPCATNCAMQTRDARCCMKLKAATREPLKDAGLFKETQRIDIARYVNRTLKRWR